MRKRPPTQRTVATRFTVAATDPLATMTVDAPLTFEQVEGIARHTLGTDAIALDAYTVTLVDPSTGLLAVTVQVHAAPPPQ